jgi:hypothetical protein
MSAPSATIDTSALKKLIKNNNDANNNLNVNQPGVLGIIQNENTRLDEKQKAVNNMKFEQERVIQMNRNLQQRTAAFNQIIIIVFVSLAIMVVVLFLGRFIPGFEIFVNLICIIVLGIGVCYALYLYLLITQRQVNNYDLINLDTNSSAPKSTNTNNPLDNSYEFNDLIKFTCNGASCCDDASTTWNGNACVKSDGFATLTDAYAYSDYISSQTEPVSVNKPVSLMPVQLSAQSCQNPIAYPSQYPKA